VHHIHCLIQQMKVDLYLPFSVVEVMYQYIEQPTHRYSVVMSSVIDQKMGILKLFA